MSRFNVADWRFDPEMARMRMHYMSDEDLLPYIVHSWQIVRDAARAEAAARWAETIMPRGDR